jgi:hypothetical protein
VPKNFIIGVLAVAVLVLGSALVRVENQRYALSLGMCPGPAAGVPPDLACVSKTETRTGWWAHLFAALTD